MPGTLDPPGIVAVGPEHPRIRSSPTGSRASATALRMVSPTALLRLRRSRNALPTASFPLVSALAPGGTPAVGEQLHLAGAVATPGGGACGSRSRGRRPPLGPSAPWPRDHEGSGCAVHGLWSHVRPGTSPNDHGRRNGDHSRMPLARALVCYSGPDLNEHSFMPLDHGGRETLSLR